MNTVPVRVVERVLARAGDTTDDCWLWPLSVGSHGYGQIGWTDEQGTTHTVLVHRASWAAHHGEIIDGLTVDHICRVRRCFNPRHLRLLTNVANATDNGQGRKTHCPAGHAYDVENTYVSPKGDRRCRACAREGGPARNTRYLDRHRDRRNERRRMARKAV